MLPDADKVIIPIQNEQYYMQDTLDGILWNTKTKYNYADTFINILKTISLTGRSKLIIKERFINLYKKFRGDKSFFVVLNNISKVTVTIFGIFVPALIALDGQLNPKQGVSAIISYVTFGLSLSISLINALLELFQIANKSYTLSTVTENMETEGWLFLSLTGKYHNYTDHSECWRKFLYRVEKLNINNSSVAFSDIVENLDKKTINIPINLDKESESESNKSPNQNIIYVNN